MSHHELWPTSVSHPFSFLNSSLGLAGEKHYQKITIPIFRLVLQNFAIPGYFPYAPVPLANDATALIRRKKKITDTQQDRRDGLVEHLRRYYFACVAYQLNCVSMTHGWRTCGAYGVWMAMPLRMMSRMRTWPLRIHGESGVCTAYIPRTRGGQRDSMAYGGRMYSAWAAYMANLWIHLIICELWMWHLNVHIVEHICI